MEFQAKDLLLLVWVHGYVPPVFVSPAGDVLIGRFKGTDVTFEAFPERGLPLSHRSLWASADVYTGVCHLLRATHPTLRVESRVFPAYETRGELVRSFSFLVRPLA